MSVSRKSRKTKRVIPEVPEGYKPYDRKPNSKPYLACDKYRSIVATLNNFTGVYLIYILTLRRGGTSYQKTLS